MWNFFLSFRARFDFGKLAYVNRNCGVCEVVCLKYPSNVFLVAVIYSPHKVINHGLWYFFIAHLCTNSANALFTFFSVLHHSLWESWGAGSKNLRWRCAVHKINVDHYTPRRHNSFRYAHWWLSAVANFKTKTALNFFVFSGIMRWLCFVLLWLNWSIFRMCIQHGIMQKIVHTQWERNVNRNT